MQTVAVEQSLIPSPVVTPDDVQATAQLPLAVPSRSDKDELRSSNQQDQPLLSGWVRLAQINSAPSLAESMPRERVWLRVTDLTLSVRGSSTHVLADDILSVSGPFAAPASARGFRVTLLVRKGSGLLEVPSPASPSPHTPGGVPGSQSSPSTPSSPLRRGSEQLLSLLSPLWRASRMSLLPRSSGLRGRRTSAPSPQRKGVEYFLELDTSWEAEAWKQAIDEAREALVRCACHGRWESVRRLLLAGRSPNTREANGRTALHYAGGHGETGALAALIAAGASVSATDSLGVSPLAMAALHAQAACVHSLLEAGANPLMPAKGGQLVGRTPADIARHVGSVECVSLIVNVCWLSLLPFPLKLAVVAELPPPALRALEVTNSTWRQLVLAGRQLGVLSTIPPPHPSVCYRKLPAPLLLPRPGDLPLDQMYEEDEEVGAEAGTGEAAAMDDHRPTLVLDLDETLVHASVAPTPKDDFSFSFLFGGATHTMYVRRRPFLDRLLQALKDGPWEVVVFTASVRAYADQLLDVLDPDGAIFHTRLYRECAR